MYSSYERRLGNPNDSAKVPHYPGFSLAAAEFLLRQHNIVDMG